MKKTISIFLFFLWVQHVNCQSIYYDALRLREKGVGQEYIENTSVIKLPETESLIKFLSAGSYCRNGQNIKDAFKDNPFIQIELTSTALKNIKNTSAASLYSPPSGNGAPFNSLSSDYLDGTSINDGVSGFLVNRTKHEFNPHCSLSIKIG